MNPLEYFYANFFSVGALIPTLFHLFLAFLFLRIPNKSKSTFHLGMGFLYAFFFNFGYFIAGSFYHPLAAYHRWITVGVVILLETHYNMFLFYLHEERYPRFGKVFLAAQYCISISVAAVFFAVTSNSEKIYQFTGHYWDFKADEISKIIGIIILVFVLISVPLTLWKFFTVKSRDRWLILSMGMLYLLAGTLPSVANILSREGMLDRGIYQITWDLSNIIGYFLIAILYINYTKDKTTIMAKVIGISLVTLLLVLQFLSYFSFIDQEESYNNIHRTYTRMYLDSKVSFPDTSYIMTYSVTDRSMTRHYWSDDELINMDFTDIEEQFINAYLLTEIYNLPDARFSEALGEILKKSPPGFRGYGNALLKYAATIGPNDEGKGLGSLRYLSGLAKNIEYYHSIMQRMPNRDFRKSAEGFLRNDHGEFNYFSEVMLQHLGESGSEGKALKSEILRYTQPLYLPGYRHYRNFKDHHYISFMEVDSKNALVYEIGFSYLQYRGYLHPSSLKFIYILIAILFMLTFGFPLFFRRALVMPLERLVEGSREVSNGNLDIRIPVTVEDEMGFLTHNFNAMVETIRRARTRLDEYTLTLEDRVSERTRELSMSEERYRSTIENISEGYYEVDLAGSITFFNNAFCAVIGRTPEETLGISYREFMTPESADVIYRGFNKTFTTGERARFLDWELTRKSGEKRLAEASVELIVDDEGKKTGFRGMIRDVTEKKAAEVALQKSEEKYRSILGSIEEGYFEVDTGGSVTFFNDSMCRILGYGPEEIIGLNYGKLADRENAEKIFRIFNDVYTSGRSSPVFDYRFIRKDGEVRIAEGSTTLITDNDGNKTGFRGVLRDITERKKAEEALKKSEEKYRTILENIKEGYYELDLEGNFAFFNDALCQIWGRPREKMLGLNFREYMAPAAAQSAAEEFKRIFQGGKEGALHEWEIVREDGKKLEVEISIGLIRNNEGGVTGFRGIIRDTTERKEAEEALRMSEERYRHIIDYANDIIYRNDWRGNFLFMNPGGLNQLGYSLEELLKLNYISIIPDEYRGQESNFYREQQMQGTSEFYHELPVKKKDGTVLWLEQNVRAVKERDGSVEYYGIARDVTKRKEAEEALRELDRQKSRFFANISHEIRTPLTLILSPIESVLQGDYGQKVDRAFFRNIQKNALRLLNLINNLLDFSKIEAGRMSMKVREADIVSFVRNYIGTIHSASESRGIKLEFVSARKKISNLYFDPEKMDKVVMNLLSNAIKFTDTGGAIRVRLKEDEVYCYIEVKDNGVGIPSDKLDSIFDRFSQADNSSTRRHEGTGIGLSLARELAALHGGTISVRSRYIKDYPENHGTTFTVTLLKGKEHLEGMDNVEFIDGDDLKESVMDHQLLGLREMARLKREDENETADDTGAGQITDDEAEAYPATLLIVDDNPDMRNFLAFLLKKRYTVFTAVNGKEGLTKAGAISPDLIITDVMMPLMNGYEMTEEIKKDPNLRQIPVIMLTAKAEIANKIEGLEYGADDYLTKPFNSKELLTRIRSLLKTYTYQKIITERNREVEAELEIARLIQQKLLPQNIPEIANYRSHVTYIPMDKVGGDFYDFWNRDGYIELFIADVSGHGLPGAFLSLITKMTLENITSRNSSSAVLLDLNKSIYRSTVKNNFVTSFFGIIDTRTNIMRFSNAGHFPPLIYRKKEKAFFDLNAKGIPLGWFSTINLEEKEFLLCPGDRLVLYTDGITECLGPDGKQFGDDRLKDFIQSNIDLHPEEFSSSLLGHLRSFSGSHGFDDDLCLIVFDVL